MTYDFVPTGVAHVSVDDQVATRSVAFVLCPGMSMLAFTSAIEPLRIANQLSGRRLYAWQVLSEHGAAVQCSNGVSVNVDGDFSALSRDAIVLLCAGVSPERNIPAGLCSSFRHLWRSGRTVGGLCTGAYGLAKAGILKGHEFTLHWENLIPFRELHPDLEPSEKLYTCDGRIWTCAGGTASMDLMVSMIASDYGPTLTEAITSMCMQPHLRGSSERQRPSMSVRFGSRNPHLVSVLNSMHTAVETGMDIAGVAAEIGISERQLQRHFRKYLGTSPREYLRSLRLQRARALLGETDLSVTEVAVATGFSSAAILARWFKKQYGQSPYAYTNARLKL